MTEQQDNSRYCNVTVSAQHGTDATSRRNAHPGVAVAVVCNGKIVHTAASGVCKVTPHSLDTCAVSVDPDTLFLTASISKTIVAIACLQAVERGEFHLDCDIAKQRAPPQNADEGFPAVRNPHFPDAEITPRHLLTHTAGLRDDEAALMPGKYRVDNEDYPHSLVHYVRRRLLSSGGDFSKRLWTEEAAPGEASYGYSNAGFTLLAACLEYATGQSLHQLVRDHIFTPLDMHRSSFSLPDAQHRAGLNIATPHVDRKPIQHYGVAEWPAAQLRSTANDLGKLLCSLTTPRPCPILSDSSIASMLPASGQGGLAWWGQDAVYSCHEDGLWEHGGFMDGVRTHIYLWPSLSCGAVLLTNGTSDYSEIEREIKKAIHIDTVMHSTNELQ